MRESEKVEREGEERSREQGGEGSGRGERAGVGGTRGMKRERERDGPGRMRGRAWNGEGTERTHQRAWAHQPTPSASATVLKNPAHRCSHCCRCRHRRPGSRCHSLLAFAPAVAIAITSRLHRSSSTLGIVAACRSWWLWTWLVVDVVGRG